MGCFVLGARHLQVLLMFVSMVLVYCLRSSMSVAIVAMTNSTNTNPDFPEFPWSSYERGLVLSSFSWAYVVMHLPGGLLAERTGAANSLVALTLAVSGVAALLTPLSAEHGGWQLVVACRVVQGAVQGCLYPSFHLLIAYWLPPTERGLLATLAYAGGLVGTVVGMSSSGFLAAGPAGWPSIFYLFGGIATSWSGLCWFVGADNPRRSRFISQRERDYIEATNTQKSTNTQVRSTPWLSILKSPAVWALVVVESGECWGFWLLLTEIPTYMDSVLHFNISQNGLLSALPYLSMWVLSLGVGPLSFWLQKKNILSVTASRKTFNSVALYGPAAALIGVAYSPTDNPTLVVALLVLAVGLNAGVYAGYQIVHVDMAPNYSATLMGFANGIGNIMSIVGPIAVGGIVVHGTYEEWRIVFLISAAMYAVTNTIFLVFGTAEVQPWNDPDHRARSTKEERLPAIVENDAARTPK